MLSIQKIKSVSIWIFLVPFISTNTCLILITQFQWIFPNQEHVIWNTFPYFDGGASISRVTRYYPNWLIFKPSMFLTSFLLIKYWLYNKEIIKSFKKELVKYINHKYLKIKLILVTTLITVAVISIPFITLPGNKFLKHSLEWNYFFGVIVFYLLSFLMWKKTINHK